jgi:hypothetical protein
VAVMLRPRSCYVTLKLVLDLKPYYVAFRLGPNIGHMAPRLCLDLGFVAPMLGIDLGHLF